MKKFIINFLIFAFAFFLFDKLFYVVTYYSAEKEIDKRLEKLINGEINKEVVIVGSSRGARNILASQIEAETGQSAYNLSYPGSDITFHEFIIKTLLKFNKHPKLIILTVDEVDEFLPSQSLVFRLDRLYPLVKYNYIAQELAEREGKSVLMSKLFVLYNMKKKNFDLRQKHFTSLDTIMDCGSMPVSFQRGKRDWIYTTDQSYSPANEVDDKIKAFQRIQKMLLKNNIQLLLCFPPNFKSKNSAFVKRIKGLSNSQVFFMRNDTSKKEIYQRAEFFYDEDHLMLNGAKIFTKEISDYLMDNIMTTDRYTRVE